CARVTSMHMAKSNDTAVVLFTFLQPAAPISTLFPYTTLFRSQWSIMSSRAESVPASCGVLLEPTSALLSPDLLDYVVEQIGGERSEEHTSELQSRGHLVCRLLLETNSEKPALAAGKLNLSRGG